MNFQVITLFPELIQTGASAGVLGQAIKKNLLTVDLVHLRDYSDNTYKSVDDRPFGGSDGMVMRPEVAAAAIAEAKNRGADKVIHLSPQGRRLDESLVRELSQNNGIVLLCGRYAGVDQRVLHSMVDDEISIGDYVLSGGELAALVVIDAVARKIPGVLGHPESANLDSFSNGMLEGPLFTRPREWNSMVVPEVLLSGNHEVIRQWQEKMGALVTLARRPELLQGASSYFYNDLRSFWRGLAENDRVVCGLHNLNEDSFKST